MSGNALNLYLDDMSRTVPTGADLRTDLVTANLPLVVHIAKKFKAGIPLDDLVAAGNFALVNSVRSYRPELGAFATYAGRAIRNEFIKVWDKRRAVNPSRSDSYAARKAGRPIELHKVDLQDVPGLVAADTIGDVDAADEMEKINRRIKSRLNEQQKHIFSRLRDGAKHREIAAELGTSRENITYACRVIFAILRRDTVKHCRTCGNVLTGKGRTVYCGYQCSVALAEQARAVKAKVAVEAAEAAADADVTERELSMGA